MKGKKKFDRFEAVGIINLKLLPLKLSLPNRAVNMKVQDLSAILDLARVSTDALIANLEMRKIPLIPTDRLGNQLLIKASQIEMFKPSRRKNANKQRAQ